MSGATSTRTQSEGAVPFRPAEEAPPEEKARDAWASEDTVPLRDASGRVEAEERAERLRLVTGRRAQARPR
jgi:hypothetical protein